MKIVVFSDIHGNQYAFREFLKDMEHIRPDQVIFLGDVFGYYYGQEEILSVLRKSNYHCLLGNHDRYYLDLLNGKRNFDELCDRYGSGYRRNIGTISKENISFLRTLKPYLKSSYGSVRIAAFHGSPEEPLSGRIYPDKEIDLDAAYEKFDFIFLGHTHHKMKKMVGRTVIINPGSLGQQRDGKGCSYLELDTETLQSEFHTVEYPVMELISEVEKNDPRNSGLVEVLLRKR